MRLNNKQKERLAGEARIFTCVLLAGFFYYFAVAIVKINVPCVFHELTGLLCPGCGITRMILSILRLDFYAAYGYNKCIFVTIPIIAYVFISSEINYVKNGRRTLCGAAKYAAAAECILLLVFGVVRNLI